MIIYAIYSTYHLLQHLGSRYLRVTEEHNAWILIRSGNHLDIDMGV
ncbi:MAG TPA: hypothetical protein VHB01_04435 [Nitrosospira sp.]|nr:hypothetical protein [Nitrosospira sp.]